LKPASSVYCVPSVVVSSSTSLHFSVTASHTWQPEIAVICAVYVDIELLQRRRYVGTRPSISPQTSARWRAHTAIAASSVPATYASTCAFTLVTGLTSARCVVVLSPVITRCWLMVARMLPDLLCVHVYDVCGRSDQRPVLLLIGSSVSIQTTNCIVVKPRHSKQASPLRIGCTEIILPVCSLLHSVLYKTGGVFAILVTINSLSLSVTSVALFDHIICNIDVTLREMATFHTTIYQGCSHISKIGVSILPSLLRLTPLLCLSRCRPLEAS